jgi:carboxymethylenebutenolidase
VLVLHAWWGLNDTIKSVCNRLADAGYVAFAPDLYHGALADTVERAEELGSALDARFAEAKSEIAVAARYLSERVADVDPRIAIVAFSLGVYYALDLAADEPDLVCGVTIFYGSGDGDYTNSRASYLGHFADNDPYESAANVDGLEDTLRRAGRPVTFYRYPNTGHWFAEPDRIDAYDDPAAQLAWKRTLEFLERAFD